MSELLGYSLKRAQLKVFEDFLRCVAPLQLTPAQFSVLLLLDKNPGRNQTEIANTLGILRPNFVAMLDGLESRDLCARMRSTNDRRSHILVLTDKGRAVLARAKKLVATKHEARLNELLGPANRAALLGMLAKIAGEFWAGRAVPQPSLRGALRRSIPLFLCCAMDCFASLSSGAHSRDPWLAMTGEGCATASIGCECTHAATMRPGMPSVSRAGRNSRSISRRAAAG